MTFTEMQKVILARKNTHNFILRFINMLSGQKYVDGCVVADLLLSSSGRRS